MNRWFRRLIQRAFNFCQRRGFHVVLNDFLSPIPDTGTLDDNLWLNPPDSTGLDLDDQKMLNLLATFKQNYQNEYNLFPTNETHNPGQYHLNQTWFSTVDAEILYCMIRSFKPQKIIEVGSGFSTRLSAQAIHMNKTENSNYNCSLTAIEPYPTERLKDIDSITELVVKPVQDVPLSLFEELEENDILFIDSSHVLKTGSDVQRIYLKILPILNKGVTVHIHDIFIPDEYPKEWIKSNHWFWSEQYILNAFLLFNSAYQTLWASHYMATRHETEIDNTFKSYSQNPNYMPSSYWIKRH